MINIDNLISRNRCNKFFKSTTKYAKQIQNPEEIKYELKKPIIYLKVEDQGQY